MKTVYNIGIKIQPLMPGATTIKILTRANWIEDQVLIARGFDGIQDLLEYCIQHNKPLQGVSPLDSNVKVSIGPEILKSSIFESSIIAAEQ